MPDVLSKSQIDRLGEKLRKQNFGEAELRLLDEYRAAFHEAYDVVVEKVHRAMDIAVSGRPEKSTPSIIEKLRRESIRLSQIQDIAGCRVIVADVRAQDSAVERLKNVFDNVTVLDRRAMPSHGYRAVHLIIRERGKTIELQIRTVLQQLWAQLSEKYADRFDPSVKYGGGPAKIRERLDVMSRVISNLENDDRPGSAAVRQAIMILGAMINATE